MGYEVVEEDEPEPEKRVPTDRVHLQGWYDSPTIPASDVRVGDVRLFNNGEDTVIAIDQKTPKTLVFTYEEKDTEGKNYTQNVRKTTKIVIKELYDDEMRSQREQRKKFESEKPKPKPEPEIVIPEPPVEVKPEPEPEVDQYPHLTEYINSVTRKIDELNKKLELKSSLIHAKGGKISIPDQVEIDDIKSQIRDATDDRDATQRKYDEITSYSRPKPEPKSETEPKSGSVGALIGGIERDFVTPVTVEMEEKLKTFRLKAGINFQGLKKAHVASIADGLEKSLGKYNLSVSYIGWHQSRKNNAPAKYVGYPSVEGYNLISFQKTSTKNAVKVNEKTKDSFAFAKATNIAGYQEKVEAARFPSTIERNKRRLAKYQNCTRWVVANSSDDPLALVTAHEGYHAVYFRLGVEDKWKASLESMPDYIGTDDPRCCSVSEYGTSSASELFAETGAAIAYGIDIDPAIKQAFEKTMEGL